MATLNATALAAATTKLLASLEKVFADVAPDVKNPSNLLNIAADIQAYADVQTAIADVKAEIALL